MLNYDIAINTPVRQVKAKVELYSGSTLVDTYSYTDALVSVDIERVGDESKFFGFVVCQKANIKLRDINRELSITTANSFRVYFAVDDSEYITNFPMFYVTEVNRDENTNQLSITCYDALKAAEQHTVDEAYTLADNSGANIGYTVWNLVSVLPLVVDAKLSGDFNGASVYPEQLNFEGTETIRDALSAAAEFAGAIIYLQYDAVNNADYAVIKGIANAATALTIGKADYIELDSKTNRKLTTITDTNELGDSLTATTGEIGTTQFMRDNPFLEFREDRADIVDRLITLLGGLTMNQFECSWRGNFLLEIGDKIEFVTKDNETVSSFVINDTISYNGALSEKTSWTYTDNDTETANNPTALGKAIKQTYAKVDKVNKQIDMLVMESGANSEAITQLTLNLDGIQASVSNVEKQVADNAEATSDTIAELTNKVAATMTAEELKVEVQSQIANGVNKVETSTGFTFDETGLTVDKSGSEMKTTITEDGMTVYKNDEAVLTANNVGVDAVNLHATTYLIIGTNSRFEDYGGNRTGCFWIGG